MLQSLDYHGGYLFAATTEDTLWTIGCQGSASSSKPMVPLSARSRGSRRGIGSPRSSGVPGVDRPSSSLGWLHILACRLFLLVFKTRFSFYLRSSVEFEWPHVRQLTLRRVRSSEPPLSTSLFSPLLTSTTDTIGAVHRLYGLAAHPARKNIFVTLGADRQVVVWDAERRKPLFRSVLPAGQMVVSCAVST